MKNLFLKACTLVSMCFILVSCGSSSSNVLNGIEVTTERRGEEFFVNFSSELNLGSMSFASLSTPIFHPRDRYQIGQLELVSGVGGKNLIRLQINATEFVDIPDSTQVSLPNGNLIPIIGMNQAISIDIGNGAKVYLTISESVTALGVAVPISSFDGIGRTLPGLNFFPIVSQGDVVATAGIFTSLTPGQNGIAVVADLSNKFTLGDILPEPDFQVQAMEAKSEISLDYKSHTVSKNQKSRLDRLLLDLNRKRTILRMR